MDPVKREGFTALVRSFHYIPPNPLYLIKGVTPTQIQPIHSLFYSSYTAADASKHAFQN